MSESTSILHKAKVSDVLVYRHPPASV